MYLKNIILFYIFINLELTIKKIKILLLTLLSGVSLSAMYGLYQHYFLNINRISANVFVIEYAGILSMVLMYSLSFLFWGKNKKKEKIILSIYSLLFILNLVLTQTRGAWLAFLFSLFVMILIHNKKYLIYFSVFLIVFIFISQFIVPDIYINRFLSIFELENNRSNVTRINLWKSSILIYKDHFINGVGLDSFEEVIHMDEYSVKPVGTTSSAHSNYFQLAAETGTLGLLSFLLLFFIFLKKFYTSYKREEILEIKILYLATIGMIFSFLVHGGTEYILNDRFLGRIMWFLLAAGYSSIYYYNNKDLERERS